MMGLGELARRRIVAWLAANPRITQTALAQAVGVSQSWVSQYKSGDQDADIDQLDAMARVFGHTLNELLDIRPDPKERALVEAFRALLPDKRELAVKMLEGMVIPAAATRERRKALRARQCRWRPLWTAPADPSTEDLSADSG